MRTYFLLLGIWIIFASCKKDDPNPLEGCCGNPAIDQAVGNGHVYVPNIFTPDGDGINDILILYGDSNIVEVILMEVWNTDGSLLTSKTNFSPNDSSHGWDGRINGLFAKGIYTVTWEIQAADGTILTIEGDVCNYPCPDITEDDKDQVDVAGCQFPTQVNDSQFDPTIPSGEQNECFE